jgi:two-component system sensor histidine kinase PilS (NtrC family)
VPSSLLPPSTTSSPPAPSRRARSEIFATRAEHGVTAKDDALRARLVRLTLARLIAVTALLAVMLVASSGAPSTTITVTIVAVYALSIAYAAWLSRRKNLRLLAWLQIALDLSAYVAITVVTGGPVSPLSFFFAVPALTAALVLGSRAARITAAASAASYAIVTVAFVNRWVVAIGVRSWIEPSREDLVVQLAAHAVAIPLVAALASALADRLSRAGGALERLEQQRAELVVLHEDVLRSIPVGLLTVSARGEIDGANPMAEQLLRREASALLGRPAREALAFIEAAAWSQETATSGVAHVRAPDAELVLGWTVSALFGPSGAARGMLVVLEDRTQSEALRAKAERDERLAVLGRLAAGMAHEIRNPLGAIAGCVELVRESSALSEEDRALLGTVLRESARLNGLVGDMLAFARPRAAELEPIDLAALTREFVAIASKDGSPSAITLASEAGASSVIALADAQQLRQVLWNLTRNAARVSPEGAAVELWAGFDEGAPALFVADRGPGIAPEVREKIFEAFYSEGSARGTGLGLALVRQIIEAHGGAVEPRAREGGGTLFVVRLRAPEKDSSASSC